MATHIAFLRAINLGAKRKFPKASIVAAAESAGFADVATYINTGNVRLTTTMRSRAKIEAAFERACEEHAGFDVPVIVFSPAELAEVAAEAERLTTPDLERHYIYLLKSAPEAKAITTLEARSDGANRVVVRGRAAHVLLGPGYTAGSVDPYSVEKSLGVVATNRNVKVVTTLARMWAAA